MPDTEVGGIAVERLRSLVERIERLEEEKKALADVPAEATEEMAKPGVKTEPFCSFSMINAATEAGDVLRGAK